MKVVRRYRVRYAVYEDGGQRYVSKMREFPGLRAAADFMKTLPPENFLGIQTVDYGDLNEQERQAWRLFIKDAP